MKILKLSFGLMFAMFLFSCDEEYESRLTIKNEVSNVRISEIYFGNEYVDYGSLIPGQEAERIIYGYKEDWPKSGNIAFVMTANNKQVYLQTDSVYVLDKNQEIEIIIDDNTPVSSY